MVGCTGGILRVYHKERQSLGLSRPCVHGVHPTNDYVSVCGSVRVSGGRTSPQHAETSSLNLPASGTPHAIVRVSGQSGKVDMDNGLLGTSGLPW